MMHSILEIKPNGDFTKVKNFIIKLLVILAIAAGVFLAARALFDRRDVITYSILNPDRVRVVMVADDQSFTEVSARIFVKEVEAE